jgi:hypothetical protein
MDETPIVDIMSFGNYQLRGIKVRLKHRTRNVRTERVKETQEAATKTTRYEYF